MLRPDSIVLLSPFPWTGAWHTTHFIARHLADYLPTLFVEPRVAWNPSDSDFGLTRLLRGYTESRLKQHTSTLHTFLPFSVPFGRFARIESANRAAFARGVRHACQELAMTNPLFWVSYYPGCLIHLETLTMPQFIYHCLDYVEHGDAAEEHQLAQRAELVFAVSTPLVVRYQPVNPRTYLLPNGVPTEWFTRLGEPSAPPPLDLPDDQPVLGFVGNLSRHTDFILLLAVAHAYPSLCLALIGPVLTGAGGPTGDHRKALEGLRSLPNVKFLGFRPSRNLPHYIRRFDVCLMPLLPDLFVSHSDPTKFYQYLAAGKAVVSTPVSAAERYQSVCYLATTRADFLASIERALSEPAAAFAEERMAVARAHDWQRLAAQAYGHVQRALGLARVTA